MPEIIQTTENNLQTLIISGEIDASSSIDLDQAISRCLIEGTKNLLIDCTGLNYISSAGLGVFMSYVEEFKTRKSKMVIFGLNPRVSHTFSLLGLSDLLTVAENRAEAEKILNEA